MKSYLKILQKCWNYFISFSSKSQFQGQTKKKLVNDNLNKIIETPIKVKIENWLVNNKKYLLYN